MSVIFADYGLSDKCWNMRDTYGEICVGCGCCAEDKKTRYEARLATLKRWLDERVHFDAWFFDDPQLLKLQKRNIKADIKGLRNRIRYYEKELQKINEQEEKN